jgi:hypothetical protein
MRRFFSLAGRQRPNRTNAVPAWHTHLTWNEKPPTVGGKLSGSQLVVAGRVEELRQRHLLHRRHGSSGPIIRGDGLAALVIIHDLHRPALCHETAGCLQAADLRRAHKAPRFHALSVSPLKSVSPPASPRGHGAPSQKRRRPGKVRAMPKKNPHLLLINPWIFDFAAHDLWAKPLGLLLLGGLLRARGYAVRVIDCLDRHDARMGGITGFKPARRGSYGTGKFFRVEVPKPPALRSIARRYWRFGITLELFVERLFQGPAPDAILVTSAMTYWYPGVQEVIRLAHEHLPGKPVVLGGTYATLCPDHARRRSGADYVLTGPGEEKILPLLDKLTGRVVSVLDDENRQAPPAFDLLPHLDYVCVLTSRGCPFRCPYCASGLLYSRYCRRPPLEVADELEYWHERHGVSDVALYDDALLLEAREHMLPLLGEVCRRNLALRFHTPNALHVQALSAEVCEALFAANFKTLRLGLETADPAQQERLGGKARLEAFSWAMNNLSRAGFSPEEIGVYLLCGLPGQDPAEVAHSIQVVQDHGVQPYLAEYSPIPGTALWHEAVQFSPFDLEAEPLYHNNSILPCRSPSFGPEDLRVLKNRCRTTQIQGVEERARDQGIGG